MELGLGHLRLTELGLLRELPQRAISRQLQQRRRSLLTIQLLHHQLLLKLKIMANITLDI